MKISHTLIHNGISYDIPEGTKVPEKPYPNQGDGDDQYSGCREDEYDRDLQALLPVSIQWEGQEAIKKATALYHGKHREHLSDGIYPLEGVNGRIITLCQRKINPNGWFGCIEAQEIFNKDYDYKKVLRLIPQPNSEQPLLVSSGVDSTELNIRVGGVSEEEPTQLWEQAIELLRSGSSDVKERATEMSKLYHIQKLKQ